MTKAQATIFSPPDNAQDDLIAEQAIAWYTRMQSNTVSSHEQTQFKIWKTRSPAHQRVYEEITQLWNAPAFNLALGQASLSYSPEQAERKPARSYQKRWVTSLAMAASFAVLMVFFDPVTRLKADYYTGTGVNQTVQLSDGSTVQLNTNTAIAVAFNDNERRIRLLKGEAYFSVQANRQRPFVVNSGKTETTVLGTRFLVKNENAGDKITVVKGLVKVNSLQQEQSVFLHPDEQVINTKAGLSAIRKTFIQQETAWLKGRLTFQDATMKEVVKELNRYLPGIILVSDNTLKNYRINARFDI
ncbi:MAG: FecR family protein, partial [Methylococcaceae bacterium]